MPFKLGPRAVIESTFDAVDWRGGMIVRTCTGRLVPVTAGDVYFSAAASMGAV